MKILDVPQSGSLAGQTSSRNRFGQYRRTRAIPVNPNSGAQGTARSALSVNAAAWRTLTDAQRAGWSDLGTQLGRTDSLAQSYTLNGFQSFCSVNNVLSASGTALLTDAPAVTTPTGLLTSTITLTASSFSIAYTATPLGSGEKLMIFASPQRSAGRAFEGDYRLIATTAAAAASPHNLLAAYTAKFGVPILGNRVFLSLIVAKAGQQSGGLNTSKVVTA